MKTSLREHKTDFGPLFSGKPLRDEATSFEKSNFDGVTYEPAFDATRLRGEMARVYWVMSDHKWHTLGEIGTSIYYHFSHKVDSESGISARIRDLRKAKFGAHTVNRRRRGDPRKGIFEYQLL